MPTEIKRTQVVNRTAKTVNIKNPDNENCNYHYSLIPPGGSKTFKYSDKSFYMIPFEKITFRRNGDVVLKDRKGFKPAELPWPTCVFLNRGNNQAEVVKIDYNESLHLPYGIPIKKHVPFNSFYAEYESVTIEKPTEHAIPDISHPGMLTVEYRANIIRKKRNPQDLKRITELREQAYLESLRRNA